MQYFHSGHTRFAGALNNREISPVLKIQAEKIHVVEESIRDSSVPQKKIAFSGLLR